LPEFLLVAEDRQRLFVELNDVLGRGDLGPRRTSRIAAATTFEASVM
jgi:hypothetical protein